MGSIQSWGHSELLNVRIGIKAVQSKGEVKFSFVAVKRKFISISPNLEAQCVQLDQSDCLL